MFQPFMLQFHVSDYSDRLTEDARLALKGDVQSAVQTTSSTTVTRLSPSTLHVGVRFLAESPDDALDVARDALRASQRFGVDNISLRHPGTSLNIYPRRLGQKALANA